MDSLLHATRKILIERATNPPQQPTDPIPETAPPAYSASPPAYYTDDCSYDDDEDENEEEQATQDADPSPVTLTLNATTSIQGEGNLVAAGPALADATRFSALLLAAVQSLNAKAEAEARLASGEEQGGKRVRPVLNVQLVLNCGIEIHGDKNVIGFRPAAVGPKTQASQAQSVGVKRKAEEVCV